MEIDLVHSIILKSSSDRSEDEKDKLKAFLSEIISKSEIKILFNQDEALNLSQIKEYNTDETVFETRNEANGVYFVYIGSINVYHSDTVDGLSVMNHIKTFSQGEALCSLQETHGLNDTDNILGISNEYSKIFFFPFTKSNQIKLDEEEETITYNPEKFYIENPKIFNGTIDLMCQMLEEEFRIFISKEEKLTQFKNEKEITDIIANPGAKSLSQQLELIDSKHSNNYTPMSLMDMKLGVITHDTLERLKQCNNKIKNDLSAFKNFLFCDDSQKNKNLLNINMDKELKRETFKDFIFDKINKDGNLEDLLLKKRENEEALLLNKYKIKKDEKYLLDTFYCLKCKTRARNAISKSCNHLVLCEECIQSTKVCPRCGMNVSNYDKIFRS